MLTGVKVEAGKVTFRYRKSGGTRDRRMTLDAMEFIRRFLRHMLPTGFMKVMCGVRCWTAASQKGMLCPIRAIRAGLYL